MVAQMTGGRERLVFRDNLREGGTALNAERWEPYNNYGIDPPPSHIPSHKSRCSSIRDDLRLRPDAQAEVV